MPGATLANRLSRESSPYLLQHAHNPVDWFPWGEEAFAEARRRDVPIFLSIGYSTCYWCHVMEREVFEDPAIARQMNDRFVCIKVDREERPDVDDLYMTATQLLTGHGGWPMSVFLEPASLRPFWAGTYFPPEPRGGMPGFPQVLAAMDKSWRERRAEVIEQSESVAHAVRGHLAEEQAPVGLGLQQVSEAARSLLQMFDRVQGGFGGAPKFPQPVYLEFLLDVRASAADDSTRNAIDQVLRLTLDRMAIGGMFDQVGGGFHRYSVDERWLVPHFEKMLYDNAQLAQVYARAATVYADDFYRSIARSTLDYVFREMTSPDGAFFSAQDAEVDGREGGNYIWTAEEVRAALSGSADFALTAYGLTGGPNFRDPHHPEAPPANVLFLKDRPDRVGASMGMSLDDFQSRIREVNERLYAVRSTRKQPRLDDKVIAAWNGLMIGAFARAGAELQEPSYVDAADKAARFILSGMRDAEGRLLRISRAGTAKTAAFLEDYAFFIDGLIALHLAGRNTLPAARELASQARRLFGDPVPGGFFDTREGQSDLFVRARSTHDGALPSGSSIMLHNLISLHDLTRDDHFLEQAVTTLRSLSAAVARSPVSTSSATRALLAMISKGHSIADRLAALGPAPEPSAESHVAGKTFTPVEVYASTERIQIGRDQPATFKLVLRIAEGYHITAADPGPGGHGLAPLRVHVVNGSGIAAYADYAPGEPFGPDGRASLSSP
jgi:uncharacterized protein